MAACWNAPQSVNLLLRERADVNKIDTRGNSVLFKAVLRGALKGVKLLLLAGAHINKPGTCDVYSHTNTLKAHIVIKGARANEDMCMLLYVAGEKIDGTTVSSIRLGTGRTRSVAVPDFLRSLKMPSICLKIMCRNVIRKHLMDLSSSMNLLHRISQLSLPWMLTDYLLYGVSLSLDNGGSRISRRRERPPRRGR